MPFFVVLGYMLLIILMSVRGADEPYLPMWEAPLSSVIAHL